MADFALFAGVSTVLARLLGVRRLRTRDLTAFMVFTWSTVSLIAVPTDALGLMWPQYVATLMLMHPAAALIDVAYLTAFIARQGKVPPWKGFAGALPSMAALLAFRVLFMR